MNDPEDWTRQADDAASALSAEVNGLESQWPGAGESFRGFWTAVKELNERIRTAPAIKLDDKLALQHRVNELCRRARDDQRVRREDFEHLRAQVADSLELARETLADAATIATVQEVRADLALLRKQIESASSQLRGSGAWEQWQELNRTAWERLNALWDQNEGVLTAMLADAEQHIERSDSRAAKEAIKRFHSMAADLECSHRALKQLRDRAHGLWERANDLGREKHARFLEQASGRVDRWRQAQLRRSRQRESIEREIAVLGRQLDNASSGVAQALLRGQIEERKRALSSLLLQERDLQRQIDETERTLTSS